MIPGYELWDLSTGNLIGTFDTADEALEIVRCAIEDWGRDGAASLALGNLDHSSSEPVTTGDELLERTLTASAHT